MKIGIYGLGRFGSLWADLLSSHFPVLAFNRSTNRTVPSKVRLVDEDKLFTCDIIFYCIAISSFEEVIERTSSKVKPGTIVLDTCSVKVMPSEVMKRCLPDEVSIAATHPMFGPDSAKHGVKGLPIVFSPVRIDKNESELCKQIFEELGLRRVDLTPEEHDQEAAYTQGVTHFLGRVLEDLSLSESKIATVGYRKVLEVVEQTCNDPWQLFLDLQRYNPYTQEMRERLQFSLSKIMNELKP